MTIEEAVRARHSVRRYRNAPLPEDVRAALEEETAAHDRDLTETRNRLAALEKKTAKMPKTLTFATLFYIKQILLSSFI